MYSLFVSITLCQRKQLRDDLKLSYAFVRWKKTLCIRWYFYRIELNDIHETQKTGYMPYYGLKIIIYDLLHIVIAQSFISIALSMFES